ncbi:MAG: [protein-PII] uridylyltransferase [Planktomarina sp.]
MTELQRLQTPDNLICPASDLFDTLRFQDLLRAEVFDRKVLVAALLDQRKTAFAVIASEFAKQPLNSRPATSAYVYLTDCIVAVCYAAAQKLTRTATGKDMSVIAVGGYGRGEMAGHSDVDLLFLGRSAVFDDFSTIVEATLYLLWDVKLKVGHATRTIKECIQLAREDYTIRTSLVEMRHLLGDAAVTGMLHDRLWNDLFQSTAADFIEAKLAERDARHTKQGGQRYVVEPNVKEGKGGLRDLQSLFWIGKYVNDVGDASELIDQGVFTKDEFDTFVAAEDFLWAVRCHLHQITNRATDQLTFDLQVEVADRMGFKDKGGRRAVEHFMQAYFRYATTVGDLTRIFLTAMEAAHVKNEPRLATFFRRKKKVKDLYVVRQNRLDVENPDVFLADGLNLLRVFEEGLRTGYLVHPNAMRLVSANLHLLTKDVRESKEGVKLFLDLLLKHGNPERALRRMNELNVLAAFIPEFEPIVAMMQFNMYHSYTVDEHTIQTISHLARIEREELVEELPVASGILAEGVNRKVLYVALLLHDIGKGRKEDHSILGAKICRTVAPRLGLSKGDSEIVEWLVRHHLVMSDMAQKRDIADPRTVRDFAKVVGTVKRLNLLTVLTVCDISGVGPGVWNNWKASLIRALYRQTKHALEDGLEDFTRQNRGNEAKKNLRDALVGWSEKDLRRETNRHYPPYWQGLHVTAHVEFARMLHDLPSDGIEVSLIEDVDRDATRAQFAMEDHPGIFSRITGALALVGANIVDARTYTSKDGYMVAAFWIQDSEGSPYDLQRETGLERMIHKTLKGLIVTRDAMVQKDKLKKREKPFRVPTSIAFDNDGSDIYTIIEVDTRDRTGLLYDLTRTLHSMNVNVSSAVIATYGEQVVDTFYVKDMFGLKYHNAGKQEKLENKLRDAIVRGAEQALE